jgi:hypothetical protein
MDADLMNAIHNNGLRVRQALLPSNASPRLDTTKLPLIRQFKSARGLPTAR